MTYYRPLLTIWLKHTHEVRVQRIACLECPEFLRQGLLLSGFKADVDLISLLQWQWVEKKIVKVNQTMSFGQVTPKWMEPISNLKRHTVFPLISIPGAY